MIVLDNLDLSDIEIMGVLRSSPSEGYAAEGVKSIGDNLVSAENVAKRLQKLADLKLVVAVSDSRYRLHIDGENFFWGTGELWSKILHVLYIRPLPLETVQKILGEPEWKFNSALEVLRPREYLHRVGMKSFGGKDVHWWELTPDGKSYVRDELNPRESQPVEKIDLRELIIKTEENLREFISSSLSREHGANWQNDPNIGWPKAKRTELEGRLDKKRKEFPTKSFSDNLINYSYILDLKEIIRRNEKSFKPVFTEWDKFMMYFDILHKHRNPPMHSTQAMLDHEKNLCIGICGEFKQVIEHWKNGFLRKILSYSCDLLFDELEGNDPEKAKIKAIQVAQEYFEKIKKMSVEEVKTEFIDGRGDACIIKLKEGIARITVPTLARQCYMQGYSQSGRIFVTTNVFDVLDRILTTGYHTYWNIEWDIPDLDVNLLNSRVNELQNRKLPYNLLNENDLRITIDVQQRSSGIARIYLTHQNSGFNKGFTKAHKIFSPDLILSILYGEIQIPKIREMVKASL